MGGAGMSFDAAPVVGSWYRRLDRPQPFQVVAFDRAQGTVDIIYFDGTVDEWPIAHWHMLPLEVREPPQDWRGPFDVVDGSGMDAGEPAGASPSLEVTPLPEGESPEPLVAPDHSRVPGSAPAQKRRTRSAATARGRRHR